MINELESARLRRLTLPYLSRLDDIQKDVEAKGQKVILLSGNNPDLPSPQKVRNRFTEIGLKAGPEARNEKKRKQQELKDAIAEWYEIRFGKTIDSKSEILVVYSAEQSLVNVAQAFINPEEGILLPSPTRPVFMVASILAGGTAFPMPLREEKGFLPDYDAIDRRSLDRSRLLFLNFPSNPTTVMATEEFAKRTIEFSRKTDLVVCYDNTYSEIYFDNNRPLSLFQLPEVRQAFVTEFYSLSTTLSLSDIPVGFFVGHKKLIENMSKIFRCVENDLPLSVMEAAIVGLRECWTDVEGYRKTYKQRRDVFCASLKSAGLDFVMPQASYFVWVKIPRGYNADTFSEHLLREAGVRVRPGTAFGTAGQGFVRMSLTVPDDLLAQAGQQLKSCLQKK